MDRYKKLGGIYLMYFAADNPEGPAKEERTFIKMDLQRFAENSDGGEGVENQDPGVQNIGGNEPAGDPRESLENPLFSILEGAGEGEGTAENEEGSQEGTEQREGQTGQGQGEGQEEYLSQIPDKFKNEDGSVNIEALAKSYLNIESLNGRRSQEIRDLTQKLEALEQKIAQSQSQEGRRTEENDGQGQGEETTTSNLTPEKFIDEFYDNPIETLKKFILSDIKGELSKELNSLKEEVLPVVQKHKQDEVRAKYNSMYAQTKEKYEDFAQLEPQIEQVLKDVGPAAINMDNPYEAAYQIVKNQIGNNNVSPDELMKDENFINQLLQNETIQQKVIQQLKTNRDKIPVVIGSQTGGEPPATPPENITNTRDATKAAKNFFNRFLTGGGK